MGGSDLGGVRGGRLARLSPEFPLVARDADRATGARQLGLYYLSRAVEQGLTFLCFVFLLARSCGRSVAVVPGHPDPGAVLLCVLPVVSPLVRARWWRCHSWVGLHGAAAVRVAGIVKADFTFWRRPRDADELRPEHLALAGDGARSREAPGCDRRLRVGGFGRRAARADWAGHGCAEAGAAHAGVVSLVR